MENIYREIEYLEMMRHCHLDQALPNSIAMRSKQMKMRDLCLRKPFRMSMLLRFLIQGDAAIAKTYPFV